MRWLALRDPKSQIQTKEVKERQYLDTSDSQTSMRILNSIFYKGKNSLKK